MVGVCLPPLVPCPVKSILRRFRPYKSTPSAYVYAARPVRPRAKPYLKSLSRVFVFLPNSSNRYKSPAGFLLVHIRFYCQSLTAFPLGRFWGSVYIRPSSSPVPGVSEPRSARFLRPDVFCSIVHKIAFQHPQMSFVGCLSNSSRCFPRFVPGLCALRVIC